MINETTKTLISAKERIKDKRNWWDGSNDNTPFQECAVMAIWRTLGYKPIGAHLLKDCDAEQLLKLSCHQLFGDATVPNINDNLGHDAIMRAYDHAIKLSIQQDILLVVINKKVDNG